MTDRDGRASGVGQQGGWRELAVVVFVGLVLTTAFSYPLAFHLGSIGRVDSADGQFSVWNVAWVARTLVLDPRHVFDANIFFPHRGTLFYSEANIGAGLLAIAPYWLTRNPFVANNVVTLLSFLLSGVGTYYLVRYLTSDRRAAAVGAICFAFCPYVFAHIPHVQLLMTAGLPFSMLAFHRLADRPGAGRAVVLGLTMAAQAISCGYYGIFAMLMVGFATLVLATTRSLWGNSRYWRGIGTAAVVALVAVLPILVPYLELQRTTGFARTLGAGQQFSADWRSYLASSAYAHAWMLGLLGEWREVAFPGFVATVLGVAGAVAGCSGRGRGRETACLYGGMVVLAFWTSLGPAGGLYTALYWTVPGFTLLRAASRFCVVVALGLSTLAGVTIASLLTRSAHAGRLAVVLGLLAVLDVAVAVPYRPVPAVEPAYRILASLPRGAVLELPVYSRPLAFERAQYMLGSTVHWMPLVDAYSDYIPADLNDNLDTLGDFPNRQAFALLGRDGVRYALFHVDHYGPAATARLEDALREFAPYLRRIWADERIHVYEIVGIPPPQ